MTWCCAALPLAYLQENGIANKPALAKAEENSLILCAGQGAYEGDALDDTQALADLAGIVILKPPASLFLKSNRIMLPTHFFCPFFVPGSCTDIGE